MHNWRGVGKTETFWSNEIFHTVPKMLYRFVSLQIVSTLISYRVMSVYTCCHNFASFRLVIEICRVFVLKWFRIRIFLDVSVKNITG